MKKYHDARSRIEAAKEAAARLREEALEEQKAAEIADANEEDPAMLQADVDVDVGSGASYVVLSQEELDAEVNGPCAKSLEV